MRTIQISKTGTFNPEHLPAWYSVQTNLGVQRQIVRDFVIDADFVYRHYVHGPIAADLNHFKSVRGPAIRQCTAAEAASPSALCSNGPFTVNQAGAVQTYEGLLVRADKRLSGHFQVLGSYALSSNVGTSAGGGFNNDNWLQNRGPTAFDVTHIVNIAGMVQAPGHIDLGLNFSYSSAPPLSATVAGIDFNGDGTTGDLLPGTSVNALNRGMGSAELERLVARFDQAYALKADAQGRAIPFIALPAHYSFGRSFQALDLRLTRTFVLRDHVRLSLIGEVFNVYNRANLSGFSGDLTSAAFGQPTARATQIFGSGGPRAFQFAVRASF